MTKYTWHVKTARFLKYVWPFFRITHESVKRSRFSTILRKLTSISWSTTLGLILGKTEYYKFEINPANIYFLKVNNRNIKKGVKYVQSLQQKQQTDITPFVVSFGDFEQVNASWDW